MDTSVILAIYFDETHAAWAADQLNKNSGKLLMSTVNLAEAMILIRDRQPALADDLEQRLLGSGIRFIPPDVAQARVAAQARLRFPLNLGDCFAYALAIAENCPILTLDTNFRGVDRDVLLPA